MRKAINELSTEGRDKHKNPVSEWGSKNGNEETGRRKEMRSMLKRKKGESGWSLKAK